MNRYEWKLERRRERLEARADRLARESERAIESGMGRLRAIPFGQPILVGHHSEKRDRNYRRKAVAAVNRGMELNKAAGEAAARAASVGKGGISSDDPDAVAKLREQLAKCEALQVRMAAANKCVRKQDRAGLEAQGFSPTQIDNLFTPDFSGRLGFPSFELTNNGANIRRLKGRIAELERTATREPTRRELEGVSLIENVELNRIQLVFPGKPAPAVRDLLKRHGFRWSPSEGAWQRHLNGSGQYAAQCVLEQMRAAS